MSLLVVISLGTVACQKDVSPFVPFVGQVSRSAYFEYHDQVNESLCPGLLPLLDRHAEMIGGSVGLSLSPAVPPFLYYRFQNLLGYVESFSYSGGSTIGDSVYSPFYFSAHEQVHAYVHRAWGGLSNGLLSEGIAVALSCEPMDDLAYGISYDWRDFLHLHGDSYAGYSLAGHFATYLIRQYGMHKYAQFYQAVPDGADAADFEAEFASVYPLSMNQAWRDATQAGAYSDIIGCFGDWDCWTTGPLNLGEEVTQDCANGIHRTLTVGDGQGGVLLVKNGGYLAVWKTCWDTAGPSLVIAEGASSAVHWIVMDPGTYTLTLWGTTDMQLQRYLPSPLLGETCDTAGEVQLDGQLTTQINFPPVAGLSGWIRLAGVVPGSFDLTLDKLGLSDSQFLPPADRSSMTLCDSCDPTATCVAIQSGITQTVLVNQGSVLRLQNIDTRQYSIVSQAGAGLWFQPVHVGADQ